MRTWRDGVENILTVEHELRTINITDYFGGETPYSAITLNDVALPNQLAVKIENDLVFTTPYSCDPNFNEIITGVGYVTNLGEGDKISCESSPEYFFSSEGLEVLDDENDIVIADNTTGQTDKVYYGANPDDISEKTLTVSEKTLFDGSALDYLNYNIEGTDDDDILIGGAGADTISAGAGDDYIESGDGDDLIYSGTGNDVIDAGVGVDTIYTEGTGLKTVTGGNGNNTFVCGAASTTITDAKAGDVVAIQILTQDAGNFYGFTFVRGDGTPESTSTDLTITYHDDRHLGDDKIIVLENYFKKVGDDYVMNDNAVTDFRLIGSNYTKDYVLEWKQSPADGEYHMYNIVTEGDAQHIFRGAMSMRNWIVGSGEADILIGDETDDVLLGGAGNDTINGGYGNDYIDGGDGYNMFEFEQNLLAPDSHITINNSHLGDLIRFNWDVPRFKATYDFDNNQAIFTFYAIVQGEEKDYRIISVKDFDYYDTEHKNIDNIEIFNGANYTPYMILGNVKFDRIIDNSYGGVYVKDTPYMENLIITSTIPVTVSGLLEGDNIVFDSVEGASTSYSLDENGMKVVYNNPNLLGAERTVTIADFDYTTDPLNVYVGNAEDTNRDRLTITGYSDFHAAHMKAAFTSYDITTNNHDSYIYTGAGNDTITSGEGDDFIESGAGDDIINTGAGVDCVNSGEGDDVINTGEGNDIIILDGAGTKIITGGAGENKFHLKNGSAAITDAKAGDMIEFATFATGNIEFTKGKGAGAQDLIISSTFEGNEDSVVIKNYFNIDGSVADNHINTFVIDGTKYTFEWLQDINGEYHMYNVIEGTDEPDNLQSIAGIRNWIKGKGADDTILGSSEEDVLVGNTGNDTITGGEGTDTFVFNPGDGNDTITDAHAGDIIEFGKGSADFSKDMFERSAIEGHTDDLIITYSKVTPANPDTITLENYFSEAAGLRLSTYVTSDGVTHEFIASDEQISSEDIQDNSGKVNINKDTTGEIKVDASGYVSPSAKGIVVNNNSANAALDVAGSFYNDTINTSKSNGNNTVVESYGTNTIKTGKGNDYVMAENYSSNTINVGDGNNVVILDSVGTNKVTAGSGNDMVSVTNYSSNTINVGAGNNEVIIDGAGTNKVTAGNDNNTIAVNTGINTIKLGKGNNTISFAGGINTVNTGAGDNVVTIGDGINKVTTGKGDDEINIHDGNNTINSGASKTQVEKVGGLYVGGDQYYINGGYNTIKSTGSTYVNIIDSSTNTITTGGKNDIFEIDGGVNNIKGGAGADKYTFNSLNNDNKTVITDSKGDDVYDFTAVNSFDGIVAINDKNGVDTIKLADNSLKLFFDGTFNKKTGEFKFGKDTAFVTEVTTEVTNGIQITGKSVDKLDIECADNSLYDLDALKGAVTAWFTEHDSYTSVSDVFDSEDQTDINSLLNVYNNTPPNA